eukprot:154569-Prorocentrum_minimum.AAC.1
MSHLRALGDVRVRRVRGGAVQPKQILHCEHAHHPRLERRQNRIQLLHIRHTKLRMSVDQGWPIR